MVLNWILTTIGFILVVLIIRQLVAAVHIFQNLYSQLITAENISLPAEPGILAKTASNNTVIPDNEASLPTNGLEIPPLSSIDRDENLNVDETAPLFVASLRGTRFHRLDCSSVKRIREDNRQYFNSHEEAVASGYNPCTICHP